MKVVTELMVVALMDSMLLDAKRIESLLAINIKHSMGCELDLLVAKNHVESIERKIKIIREESWNGSNFYNHPKEIA